MQTSDIIKAMYLINAKENGWNVIYKDNSTFYIIKEKSISKDFNFNYEISKLKEKPINLKLIVNTSKNK